MIRDFRQSKASPTDIECEKALFQVSVRSVSVKEERLLQI